jgi:RimJ/RimL family protein N-acetyltransferase
VTEPALLREDPHQTTITIPTVVTARLVLRAWLPRDIGPYTDMAADPEMSRHTTSPASEAAVWRMTAFQLGHWALNGFGMWIAEERESGEFLGRIGLYYEPGWPGVEVAWTIRRDRWGEGFATEGGSAALRYGFETIGADPIVSIIGPANAASAAVAAKLGLTVDHVEDHAGRPHNIWAITRAAWESGQCLDS